MKKLILFALVLTLALAFCLVGCNNSGGGSTGKIADNTEILSEVTNTCKLTKTYEGKSFLQDGIGEATVAYLTDGDTFTAKLKKEGTNATIRFHSIDTPESTGSVQKWGKAASNFVKERLGKAGVQIVLEATATPAELDSYGSRYLGYVWYRYSVSENFKNLNLEIVENGFSENMGNDTTKFPYNEYFKKAENAAHAIKLRMWSDLPDPLYSENPVETTIKDIYDQIDIYYNAEHDSGAKVTIDAYIKSATVSATGTTSFIAAQRDAATGVEYEIQIYGGYSSMSGSKLMVGHYYNIIGDIQKHNSKFQIASIKFNTMLSNSKGYTTIKQRNYYLVFDNNLEYVDNYSDVLYTDVTVVSSSVENNVLTIEGTAYKRSYSGKSEDTTAFTFRVNVEEGFVNNFTTGKTFSVQGYQFTENSGVIDILNYSAITLK